MKQFVILIISLGLLSILLITCKKDTTAIEPQPKPKPEPTEFEISDFPNTPGWHYTYLVKDSTVQPVTDTVEVDIVGDTLLPGNRTATIWRYQYSNITDTMYVWAHEDTLRFYTRWDFNTPRLMFIFPLRVGSQWHRVYWNDTTKVIDKEPVQVIAGSFPESYCLHDSWAGLNDYGIDFYWLVPDVGIVKMNLSEYLLIQDWELMGYSFPE
ncbi:MAG: hypothetical protein D6732_17700 [Methanobacteriota archaeon]|nr:MAG: hypothetical protein D6732_17700 [Euryarchaeota archaeon]